MSLFRYSWLLILICSLVACQSNELKRPANLGQTQLRAMLTKENGNWIATDCIDKTKQRFQLKDEVDFITDANHLLTKPTTPLFIDVIGVADKEGVFTVKKLNRLTSNVNRGCDEADFNKVVVRSIGKNPLWAASIAIKGLVLERANQDVIVLPYVEERLPAGQMNFATDANNQHIELWVAPERCMDQETGDIYSMTARLTINYQIFQGCAYLGKAAGIL